MFVKTLIASAAVLATVASGAACPSSEITKLVPIASNENLTPCSNDSGYNLLSPTGDPDTATLTKMCASDACKALIKAVIALNPSDCELTIGSATFNVYSLTSTFDSDCAALTATPSTASSSSSSTTPSPTTSAPSSTTATPSSTTATPSPTTTTSTTTTTTTTSPPSSNTTTTTENAC